MDLPFKLYKKHKSDTKCQWKRYGLICTNEELEDLKIKYILTIYNENG